MFSKTSCLVAHTAFLTFLLLSNTPRKDYGMFYYSFINRGIVWLFSLSGCYEQCYYKHLCTSYCVKICFQSSWDSYLGVEFLGHMVILWLTVWETVKLFSTVSTPFYILTSNIWGLWFLHILFNTFYFPLKNKLWPL